MRYRVLVAALALFAATTPLFMVLAPRASAYTLTRYYETKYVADDANHCAAARRYFPNRTAGETCHIVLHRTVTINSAVPQCRWIDAYVEGGLTLWRIDMEVEWCFNGTNWAAIDWQNCYVDHAYGFSVTIDWCGAWNNGDPRQIGRIEPGVNYHIDLTMGPIPFERSGWIRMYAGDNGSWCCLSGGLR